MRIGLFTDTYSPEINGVVSSVLTLQKELEEHGHDVFVITTTSKSLLTSMENNILRLPGIELKSLYGYVATSPIHFFAKDKIEHLKLDIIHAHTEFGVGIFARICSKSLSIPLVSTYHTTYEDYTHYVNIFNLDTFEHYTKKIVARLSKIYAESCVKVISPSNKTKLMLENYNIKKDIEVIPTGIDLKRFDRTNIDENKIKEIRNLYKINDHDKTVVYIGRIAKEKSIDILIDAFSMIDDMNYKLIIVGGGPMEKQLQDKVQIMQLQNRIIFTGKIANELIPYYYHSFDAFASASTTETQGMTFIEALASGLTVFARYDEVLEDLIFEGKNGYLFEDAKILSNKIIAYFKNNIDLSDNAIASVKIYDNEIFYDKVFKVYLDAIDLYKDFYIIDKVLVKANYTKLLLKKENENMEIDISNDDFYELGLRRNIKISKQMIDKLVADKDVLDVYLKCISRLSRKDRTIKEMYDYITINFDIDIKDVNDIIDKLEEKGYLNDELYSYNYVTSTFASFLGRNKITYYLKKQGISIDIIEKTFDNISSLEFDEYNNAMKYANRQKLSIKNKSLLETKQILKRKLYSQGFDLKIIQDVLSNIDFSSFEEIELENLKKEAKKIYNKKSKMLHGTQLRNSIFKSLMLKGYGYENIYLILNEMGWEDE